MIDIRFVGHQYHMGCFHVLRGSDFVGSGGTHFWSFEKEYFTAQELRAIADELDRRNGVKDES